MAIKVLYKKNGLDNQIICYAISERELLGPYHTIPYMMAVTFDLEQTIKHLELINRVPDRNYYLNEIIVDRCKVDMSSSDMGWIRGGTTVRTRKIA